MLPRRKEKTWKNRFKTGAGITAGVLVFVVCIFAGRNDKLFTEEETETASVSVKETAGIVTAAETEIEAKAETKTVSEDNPIVSQEKFDFTLSFAGDICFDENCMVMQYYRDKGEELSECISPELIRLMNEADILWINNEFSYSLRGEPLENKVYTFRASPERVKMLKELGVDIAGLANNHVYDYGRDAFEDTLDTLRKAGITYVGAGENLKEAAAPVYMEVDGKKIAYVAASRAEKYKMTPQAGEEEPGILRCYDTELFLEEIKKARLEADYVIALVHWGTEYSTELEEAQLLTGKEYIEAGADVVIGAHPHCLQGLEYYQGKPVIYSLGNFWFNEKPLDTMLLQLHIYGDEKTSAMDVRIVPARQENCRTEKLEGEEAERVFDYLEELSDNVEIDEDGILHER